MKDRITRYKNGQLVTGGIFYCRESTKMRGCGSLQTSSGLDSEVLRNRQQKHTAKTLWASLNLIEVYGRLTTYSDRKEK